MASSKKVPAYCRHRAKNLAYVKIRGHFVYLGRYGSADSKRRYAEIVAHLAHGQPIVTPENAVIIDDLLEAFLLDAEKRYTAQSRERGNYRRLCRPLHETYGDMAIADFGPRDLKTIRQGMIDRGLCRKSINRHVGRIRRIFRFGVAEDLVPPEVLAKLEAVDGIRAGSPGVKESKRVGPANPEHVAAAIAAAPPTVGNMIRLQELTGMRSGELIGMQPELIERGNNLWVYRPASHKTAYRGHHRAVVLGPVAQAILGPILAQRSDDEPLFQPHDAWQWWLDKRHAGRKTPLGYGNAPGRSNGPARAPRKLADRYTNDTYRRALQRACKNAGVPRFRPHQLRHLAATRIRRDFDLDAARAVLGHRTLRITDHYAAVDAAAAARVAAETG